MDIFFCQNVLITNMFYHCCVPGAHKSGAASYKQAVKAATPSSPLTPSRPQPHSGSGQPSLSAGRESTIRQSSSALAAEPSSPGFSKPSKPRSTSSTPTAHGPSSNSSSTGAARKRQSMTNDANGTMTVATNRLQQSSQISKHELFILRKISVNHC